LDNDGSYKYSKIITVSGYEKPTSSFIETIYPLAGIEKQFVVKSLVNESLQLDMLNSAGQKVKSVQLLGTNIVDCSDLPTGVYYARFTNLIGEKQVVKILVR
jgi:hypothetical protein